MTNDELIAEVRRLERKANDLEQLGGAHNQAEIRVKALGLATALEQAQARIAELEAQVAELSSTIGQFIGCFEPDDQGFTNLPLTVLRDAKTVLANLPAAVQRHLARDRAAERIVIEVERAFRHGNVPEEFAEYIDAYRAVGKEE